jgi:hypothetical protein
VTPELAERIALDQTDVTWVRVDGQGAIVEHGRMGLGTCLHITETQGDTFMVPDNLSFKIGDTLNPDLVSVTPAP